MTDTQREFESWLIEQMPKGTVIDNPKWWAKRIMQSALAHSPQWIRCDERLPDENVNVLVFINEEQHVANYANGVWFDTLVFDVIGSPCYWRPLFDAPVPKRIPKNCEHEFDFIEGDKEYEKCRYCHLKSKIDKSVFPNNDGSDWAV